MKLFKTALEMKEYVDEVMGRVDTLIRTMRPCVPETVSPLEYIYMSIAEAFDAGIPEPHFTTDDFGWSDLAHHVELRNECDLLAIAVVLATLKTNYAEYRGWDTNHNLTYDADKALRLWTQLYQDAIRRDIRVRCEGANVDEWSLTNLIDTIGVRVHMYVLRRNESGQLCTKIHLLDPFRGIAWYGENYEWPWSYRVFDQLRIDATTTDVLIADSESAEDLLLFWNQRRGNKEKYSLRKRGIKWKDLEVDQE